MNVDIHPNNTDTYIDPSSLDAVYDLAQNPSPLGEMIREAIGVIDRGLDIHGLDKLSISFNGGKDYVCLPRLDKLSISFNGGKDCTVLLHLLSAVLRRRNLEGIGYGPVYEVDKVVADGAVVSPALSHATLSPSAHTSQLPHSSHTPLSSTTTGVTTTPPVRSVYVLCPSPFPDVEEFVESSIKAYNLRLVRVSGSMCEALQTYLDTQDGKGVEAVLVGTSIKAYNLRLVRVSGSMCEALQTYLDTQDGKGVEAVLVGTRRNDPHGAKLEFLQHCDPGWPNLLRVHPIINWSYAQVWEYLCHPRLKVPYCHLYDDGYTSLGSTYNTFKNPALQVSSPGLPPTWKPAYALEDGNLERAGRGIGAGLEKRSGVDVPVAVNGM
ncbi:unnamed protein product [Rhizoctonia solani]|uniref:FAD synthase n=1 Tax=Rhizoctonia solani TaxID=456999 RepID=A0A8H3H2L8_9AGAM|nr:unnamed protein product [Rhizoctonia solani]